MKREKKIIKSGITFLAIFSIVFIFLNKAFSSIYYYTNTIEDFKSLSNKTNIDLIFYGSSHSYTAYNPVIFNKKCKTVSYNLGSDGLRMIFTDLIFEESLKYTHPKLVVLEVYSSSLTMPETKEAKGYQLRGLDFISNFSINKAIKVNQVYEPKEYLGVYSTLIRNHEKWNDLNLSQRYNFDKNRVYYNSGFVGSYRIIKENDKLKFKDFKTKKNNQKTIKNSLTEQSKRELQRFINIAKQNGIKVLIVSSPDLRSFYLKENIFKGLEFFSAKNNIDYINLNNYYKEIGLTIEDFRDPGHLNSYGANKTSEYLAKYISEHFILKNRSNDVVWQKIEKEYDNYKESITIYKPKVVYEKTLNKRLTEGVILKDFKIIKKNRLLKIIFNLKTDKSLLNSMRLGVNLYPTNKELKHLSSKRKESGYNFESKNTIINDSEKAQIEIITSINEIEKIKVFLYDKEKYNGVIGETIWINEFIPLNHTK
ncbi:MAG: hypothetical protein COB12_10920 [Flavobacterium sp.]|nr:MAG: hypothetical protein COB12_10920 [Flavobacterium sp.]